MEHETKRGTRAEEQDRFPAGPRTSNRTEAAALQSQLQAQWFRSKLAAEKSKHDVVQKVKEGRGDFVLLDARDLEAFERSHIPGALPMPAAEVQSRAAALTPDREHVIYCWNRT